jgi:hypothetical protein
MHNTAAAMAIQTLLKFMDLSSPESGRYRSLSSTEVKAIALVRTAAEDSNSCTSRHGLLQL